MEKYLTTKAQTNSSIASHVDYRTVLQRICYSHWANGARNGVISIEQWGMFNHEKGAIWQSHLAAQKEGVATTTTPSITDGVHRNENFVEIIPVFFHFFKIFQKKKKKIIKAILCNFSMRLLKYF